MTVVKRDAFLRALAKWDASVRLILLCGADDSGSRDMAAAAMKALGDPADPMSLTDLTPEELKADPARLADEAASVSMFGSAKLIRVTGAADTGAEAARLLLAAPAAGNPVLMVAGDLSKTSTLRKLAEESPLARVVISWPLSAGEAGSWIQARCRELGLTLEPGVGERLLATSDSDTGILARELEKFALYLDATPGTPQRLQRQHLVALGADSAEEDMSALVLAAIGGEQRQLERQMQLLGDGMAILALRAIARRLVQLADARATMDGGTPAQAAVKALRPPIFWKDVDATAAALPRWPMARIRAGLAAMLAGERAIKTVKGPGETAGRHAILRLGADGEGA
jgi:DNA polymerase-3 subunit delta